jgi:type II secretory pathway component PulF
MPWSEKKTASFCFQLSYLLDSGLPLLESINLLLCDCRGIERKRWIQVKGSLEEGISFSLALQKEKADAYLVTLVQAGEYNGQYAQCLSFAAKYYDKKIQWKQKVWQLASYPLFLLLVSFVSFLSFLKLLLPQIVNMYSTMNVPIPVITQWFVRLDPLWFAVPVLVLPVCFYVVKKRFNQMEFIMFHIPFVSRFLRLYYSYHFSLQWGMLLDSGVNILQICHLFIHTPPWPSFKKQALFLYDGLQQGNSLSILLQQSNCFTPEMIRFVRLGEEGGQLGKCLLTASQLAEIELQKKTEVILRWLEPGLLLCIGGMVFFAVMIFFLPLLNLLDGIH